MRESVDVLGDQFLIEIRGDRLWGESRGRSLFDEIRGDLISLGFKIRIVSVKRSHNSNNKVDV